MIDTPCMDNPDDWFIGKDGLQYADDPELSRDELTEALRRRRHAREACRMDCPVRVACLDRAMTNNEQYGTWGGYYEEEIKEIRAEIMRRKLREDRNGTQE